MFGIGSRRNAAIHIVDAASFFIGVSLCSFGVIVPAYVNHYTDNAWLLGLIPVIVDFGMNVPQLFGVYFFRRPRSNGTHHNPIRVYFITEFIHRFSFILIGISILVFAPDKTALLVSFYIFFIISNIVWGMAMPNWIDTLSLTIPDGERPSFMGKRDFIARVVGIISSFFLPILLSSAPFPWNYGILFLAAGFFFTAGAVPIRFFKPIHPFEEDHSGYLSGGFMNFIKKGLHLIFGNRRLLPFLAAYWALAVSRVTYAYYTPFIQSDIIRRYPENAWNGLLSLVNLSLLVFLALSAMLVGRILHRYGHRKTLVAGVAAFIVSNLAVILFPVLPVAIMGQFFLAFFMNAVYLVSLNAVMDHTPPLYRSMASSFNNIINTGAIILFSLGGSLLAGNVGYKAALGGAAVITVPVLIYLLRMPGNRPAAQQ